MKKYITLAALALSGGIAFASSTTANLGNGITGTWTEYNMAEGTTTGTNSLTLPVSWGGPTSWITLDSAIDLAKSETLTFSYTYTSATNNGIYGISFLGEGGASAFMIGNTEYANRDLAAAVTTLGTSGFYQGKAQAIRFNPGNSTDRIQAIASSDTQVKLGNVDATSGVTVSAEIAWNNDTNSFVMTLASGTASGILDLGDSVKFNTISFAADANATQSFSDISLSIIPEPSAFGLLAGLGALALAGTRRRRR